MGAVLLFRDVQVIRSTPDATVDVGGGVLGQVAEQA
jgi:hypothetical protein